MASACMGDMASACMGDIAILEVALRNRMDRQLSLLALEQNGTEDWYMAGLQFDDRTQYQIREAWNHLTPHQRKKVIRMASHSVIDIRILAQSLGRRRNNPHEVARPAPCRL